MSYYTEEELKGFGFKSLGKNVKISRMANIYNVPEVSMGDDSRIDDYCVLKGPLHIGSFVHIPPFCLVSATKEPIIIEDFVNLAYRVSVFSCSDDYSGSSLPGGLIPEEFKTSIHGMVHIQKHAIIGASSVVFPSVTIGEGCSIGALSLVNKSIAPWGIYCGIPVARIKERKKDLLELEKDFNSTRTNDG